MLSRVRLCSVVGGDLKLLPHFVKHYLQLGVTDFHFIIHAVPESPFHHQAAEILKDFNIDIAQLYDGRWDGSVVTQLINSFKTQYPDDWFVIADSDEFQLYPEDITALFAKADASGIRYITGAFLDRVSANGALQPILADPSVWEQYPCAGFISYPLARANPYKIVACHGAVEVALGQHGVVDPSSIYPIKGKVLAQVHHFKWTAGLEDRLSKRQKALEVDLSLLNKGDVAYIAECAAIQRYIQKHNGIFIHDPTFMISKAKDTFTDYSRWGDVLERTATWAELQRSPIVEILQE